MLDRLFEEIFVSVSSTRHALVDVLGTALDLRKLLVSERDSLPVVA